MYKHILAKTKFKRKWPAKIAWLAERGFFRKLAYGGGMTFMVGCIVAANIAIMPRAGADGINAQKVIGQSDFTSGYPDEGSPNARGLSQPGPTAYDAVHHRLFVGDQNNNRVLVFDNSSGITNGMAASYVLGQPNFVSTSCPIDQSHFCSPSGLAYDSVNNRLFVSDNNNSRVLVFDLSGGITNGMNATWVLGQPNFGLSNCNEGTFSASTLCQPFGLSYDSANSRLFVADAENERILVFDLSGGITNGMAAVHVLGEGNFTTAVCGHSQTGVCFPEDLTYDSGTSSLFVADTSNDRALIYDLSSGITDGMPAVHEVGQPNITSHSCLNGQDGMCNVDNVAYDSGHHYLFVNDSSNYRVMIYNLSGTITDGMNAAHELGQTDFSGTSCPSIDATNMCFPAGMTYDLADQQLFVGDSERNRVLDFNFSGTITDGMAALHELGQSDFASSMANAAVISSQGLDSPGSSVYDSAHNRLFVADSNNNRVLVYDTSSGIANGMAASHVLGQINFTDTDCSLAQNGLCNPEYMAYDSVNQRLFVSEAGSNRVLVYDLSGGISDGMVASHILGQTAYANTTGCGGGEENDSSLCAPYGVTYDSANQRLFVADAGNNRVMIYDLSGGITDGMSATHVLGDTDFMGTPAVDSDSYMTGPEDLTYDGGSQSLFVDDTEDNRVMIYDLSGGITDGMAAVHELGQPDFDNFDCNGPDSTVSASTLCYPGGVTYDSANQRLFVADSNNRVLSYDLSGGITDGMAATGVIGQTDFSSSQSNCYTGMSNLPNQNNFCNGPGLDYDNATGVLWAVDSGNNRLLAFGPAVAILTSTIPTGLINDAYSAPLAIAFGQAPFTFSITSGSLPAGVSLNPNTGAISGTPTVSGNFDFTVKVTDNNGSSDSRSLSLVIGNGSSGYNANGLLGQSDYTLGAPNRQNVSASSVYLSSGSVIDPVNHLLFVSYYYDNRVLVYNLNSDDTPVDDTADYVIGQPNFTSSSDCQTISASSLCEPSALALDTVHHHLYVADSVASRVLVYDLNTNDTPTATAGMAASAVLGTTDFTSQGDTGCSSPGPSATNICDPEGLALDPTNHLLYVTDYRASRILGYNLDSNNVPTDTTADYIIGQTDFTSDDCNQGLHSADDGTADELCLPTALAIDPVNHLLYAADNDNDRVLGYHLNANGSPVDGVAFTDFIGAEAGGLALDTTNHLLYMTDQGGGEVVGYSLNTNNTPVDTTADYFIGSACSPQVATPDCLSNPDSIVVDSVNHLIYTNDGNNYREVGYKLNSDDTPQDSTADYVIGQPDLSSNYVEGVPVANNGLFTPNGTALDPIGHHLYVSDNQNNRVLIFDLDSNNQIASSTASYVLGQPDFSSTECNGTGSPYDNPTPSTLCQPDGIAVDTTNHVLYVSDSYLGRVVGYKLDANNVPLDGAADFVFGASDLNSFGCDSVCDPASLAVDGVNHTLYVVDESAETIFGFNLTSNGGPVDTGPDYTLNEAVLGSASLALDTTYHHLFVGNDIGFSTHQVLVYPLDGNNKPTGAVPVDAIDNEQDSSCDLEGETNVGAQLCWPDALAVDPVNHRLFVFDDINSRIQVYNLDSNDMPLDQTADDVIGQPDPDGNQCNQGLPAPTQYTLCGQIGINGDDEQAFDQRGAQYDPTTYQLFVDDGDGSTNQYGLENNRVLSYEFAHITTGSLQGGTSGSAYTQQIDEAGSQGNVSYSLQGGALPPGITLDTATGILSGTPTVSGTYNFTIGLADDNGTIGIFNDSKVLSLSVTAVTPPVIPPVTPPTKPPKKPVVPIAPTTPTTPTAPTTPTTTTPSQTTPTYQSPTTGTIQTGTGAGKGHKHKPPPILKFVFPWIIFILLGLSFLRLSYQSYQERRLAGVLNKQLEQERILAEEKNNFITLSSHYLRTPVTLISNGIDLMASVEGPSTANNDLKALAQKLNFSVNTLLYQTGNVVNNASSEAANQGTSFFAGLPSFAAGFVQISSMPAVVMATALSVVFIATANFIISRIDIYNANFVVIMIEIAAVLLLGVLLAAGLRSYLRRKQMREEAQALLDNQRRLDSGRNQLIKASLESLSAPLAQLKGKVLPLSATKPGLAKPIIEGVHQLEGLVGKFTILTSLESGSMGTQNQLIDLNQTLQQTSQRYAKVLQARGLTINNQLQTTQFQQDPLLTTFILDSLINNAIKYSPPGKQITVTSHQTDGQVWVEVQDNGPGIPEQKIAELFQPFSRAENAATDFNQKGTGLSLYLDKLVTEYLGGHVDIHSNSYGTSAGFSLPATS